MTQIRAIEVRDVRFPTSRNLTGSDAMNPAPDNSMAYVIIYTDQSKLTGYGATFTIGRGNDLCVAAIEILKTKLIGMKLESLAADMAGAVRLLTGDSHLRWLGPEKGVVHLAAAGLLNSLWDLIARQKEVPVWRLLSSMSPAELVACIDFTYIDDVLDPREARSILERQLPLRQERERQLLQDGYPAYTTSIGWMGFPDEEIRRRARNAVAEGWTHFKMKVGRNPEDDERRARLVREEIGWTNKLMMDANEVWSVGEAIKRGRQLSKFDPWWLEEPTYPDDVFGHVAIANAIAPVRLATGELCQNRIIFKQLLSSRAVGFCQPDAGRLAGVNEMLAVMLMAAKFGVPVCPHAGGAGLGECMQHLSMFDFIGISGTTSDRVLEYVDHLHDPFDDPVRLSNCHYVAPIQPGFGMKLRQETLEDFEYPKGSAWRQQLEETRTAES